MHLISLGIILTILISIFQICTFKVNSILKKKAIFALIFGSLNLSLLIFYLLTVYGYFYWSGPFTLDLFNAYWPQLSKLLSIAGLPFSLALALASVCFLSIFLLYIYLGKFILINAVGFENAKPINLKFHTVEISLSPIAWARFITITCACIYALSYKAWLSREPFAIAITNNMAVSGWAPRELLDPIFDDEKIKSNPVPKTPNTNPRPLILITIDALRSDQMGVYGGILDNTPFLSSLLTRHQLQKFDVAHSICTYSYCGLLGTLRSSYWSGLKDPSPTISDALKANDFQNNFLLGGDHTNFSGLKRRYGSSIDLYKDGSVDSSSYLNDDFEVLKWIRDIDPKNPQSTFLFIHLMSVHAAGLRHKEFMKWQPSTVPIVAGQSPNKEYRVAYKNNYNNGILQADAMIRMIFKEIKNKGMLDNALVIISADHGEYLGEFNRFGHGREPYEPVSRIPLLIYDPLNPIYPDRKLASQVDIAPTLLYAIGAKIPPGWQGIPLQIKTSRASVAIGSAEVLGTVALIDGKKYKYLKKRDDHAEWLFDLSSPEAETRNIANLSDRKEVLHKIRTLNEVSEK